MDHHLLPTRGLLLIYNSDHHHHDELANKPSSLPPGHRRHYYRQLRWGRVTIFIRSMRIVTMIRRGNDEEEESREIEGNERNKGK